MYKFKLRGDGYTGNIIVEVYAKNKIEAINKAKELTNIHPRDTRKSTSHDFEIMSVEEIDLNKFFL